MKRYLIVLILVAAVALAADPVRITENDDCKTFELEVGQTAELFLTMSSGTGYTWELGEVDQTVIKVGEKRVELDNPTMPGAPVHLIWPLSALKKGEVTVEAQLVRPWMRDQPAKKASWRLLVKEKED
ncbi:MAG: protease inhibitor I42 family protein [Alphaproteobacteria bacterium]